MSPITNVESSCPIRKLEAAFFWRRVQRKGSDECWPWLGLRLSTGRGQIAVHRSDNSYKRKTAPVVSWELAHDREFPAGLVCAHICDNPNCVNPNHLRAVTQAENVRDSIRKGRYNTFGRQKLNADQVRVIRARAAAGELHKDIARTFNIARNTVWGIVARVSWAHLSADPDGRAGESASLNQHTPTLTTACDAVTDPYSDSHNRRYSDRRSAELLATFGGRQS